MAGWKDFLGQIAQIAGPAIGFSLGGPAGAAVGGALGGGANSALNKGNFFSGAAQGAAGGYLGGKLGGGATAKAPKGGGGSFSSYLNPMAGFVNPSAYMAGASGSSIPSSINPTGGSVLKKFLGNNKNLLTGLGIAGAGQLIGSPKVPELPQSVIDFQNMVKSGGSALNQKASAALGAELDRPFEQVSAEEEAAAMRQLEKDQANAEKQVRDLYRNLRPGTDPSTDSAFRRDLADVTDQFSRAKVDTLSQLRRQVSNDFQSNRIRQVLAAQGVDQQQMQNLLAANQYDVDRTLLQLQISDRDRQFLREYLTNFGGQLAFNQLDPSTQMNNAIMQRFFGVN